MNCLSCTSIANGLRGDAMDIMLLRRRLMGVDYGRFFNYYLDNGICYVTSVKTTEWYEFFHNHDVVVPETIEGCPVRIVSNS